MANDKFEAQFSVEVSKHEIYSVKNDNFPHLFIKR